ncbi:receptor-interacting serine/threonine-protein kinase 3 [Maylandia zebra]|uniref:receptor-interacting serine/threonine-protein kinase 3 n=1 Tax=Maylandia zebra TaxID=106582 RepID=UPI0006477267
MALHSSPTHAEIGDSDLDDWEVKGSGGFGQVYKARHQMWCCDVAVKLLHDDDGTSSSLLREVRMMCKGSSPYVIPVLGVFKGHSPSFGPVKLGLVMEFMERGSLANLQRTLQGPPPWPLAFRLTHQVALGINFLHNLSPALLHLDLKPSNVLLDSFLNAKLTDFGLAKFSQSVTRKSKKYSDEEEGGTISYMPPEAFSISYNPTRASDIYSYGILLWSIVTGKEPYPHALSSIVRLRIPQGDRPSLDEIRCLAAGRAGLARLMELMQKCWEAKPAQRPTSHVCTIVTEELYKMHKRAIIDAVHGVLKKLDQTETEEMTEQFERFSIAQSAVSTIVKPANICEDVPTGRPPIQEMAGSWPANQRDNTRVKESPSHRTANVSQVDQPHSAGYKMKPSSVQPIQSQPPSAPSRKPQNRSSKNICPPFKQNHFSQYQRQSSSPGNFCYPATPRINMHFCNVVGLQLGDNNTMHICATDPLERKRHPTAPSAVNVPLPHLGGWGNKAGGVG